jgi:LAO/AO transport system kinase
MLLCEAAGFDVVLVETVGVGQSELAVADMVDLFVLLVSPGGGDELQGIKRGIMELADLVVVTKADGDLVAAARNACADHRRALQLLRRPHRSIEPHALLVSSTEGTGIEEVWEQLASDHAALAEAGDLDRLRARQRRAWLWSEVTDALMDRIRTDPRVADLVPGIEAEVDAGTVAPVAAARRLLAALD